jgi:hypothetical protein
MIEDKFDKKIVELKDLFDYMSESYDFLLFVFMFSFTCIIL